MAGGSLLVKPRRWKSVQPYKVRGVTQGLCVSPRSGCFPCTLLPGHRGRYSLEPSVMVDFVSATGCPDIWAHILCVLTGLGSLHGDVTADFPTRGVVFWWEEDDQRAVDGA